MTSHIHPDFRTTRRQILRACGLLGLGWNPLAVLGALAPPSTRTGPGKARSIILIFNGGAPSHIDLWDPKPDATAEVRGSFSTIKTNVPGIHISELLPRMARRMDKLALVRSVHHEHTSHNSGMYWATAGRPYRVDSTLIHPSRTDQPGVGTLVGWLAQRDGFSRGVPPYVITPFPHCDSKVYITPGQYGGCLGARYDPFVLDDDPNAANFKVRNLALDASLTVDRLQDRLGLLHDLTARSWRLLAANAELDIFTQQAASILQSGKAAEAFDLSKEPDAVRERYGRHSWGSRTCSRGAWSRPARASSPRSMARASTGTRTRTISTGSRTNSFLRWNRPMPRCSMTSTNAASSTPRWSSGWASLAARRRSMSMRA